MPHNKKKRFSISARPILVLINVLLISLPTAGFGQDHFNAKGNEASRATATLQASLRESLPFEDESDFADASRGLIAVPDSKTILGAQGNVVWDLTRYDFLLNGEDYDSIHPSLQRQATLNLNYGLFEVVPDFLYQVRGFDLANMTLVKGDTGWIIFDVLLTSETAAAAFALATEHLGEYPIKAVIYSHSHVDHFGGVRGVIDEEDVSSGRVEVIAPSGFMEEAIAGKCLCRQCHVTTRWFSVWPDNVRPVLLGKWILLLVRVCQRAPPDSSHPLW